MFYQPKDGHGLPHSPFNAIVSPRPIGWISSLDQQGRPNLAPYSFFNAVHSSPPMLAFTSESMKHSAANAIATGEFVFNLCTRALFDAMNISSDTLPEGVSEFEAAGLATAPCRIVKAPRVAAAPAALECKVTHSMQLQDMNGAPLKGWIIIGQVVGGAGKVVEGHHRPAQVWRAQPRGDGKVFVMVYGGHGFSIVA